MRIIFLRHGEADWPDWNKPDDERPLTKSGRKEMKRVAKFLCELKPKIDAIISSPLPRALQTAEIAADRLDLKVETDARLTKRFTAAKLRELLERRKNAEGVMLVGHEPNFSEVIGELTGGRIKISKAGVALVELSDDLQDGRLLWLIPPKIAKV